MTEGKSLFSINIHDNVIQELFKEMKQEIDKLKSRIEYLTEEVEGRPSSEEFKKMSTSLQYIITKNAEHEEQLTNLNNGSNSEVKKLIEDTMRKVKTQMDDTTISINSVIRAQNALIDKKVLEMTKPSFEFTEMQHSVAEITANQENNQNKIKKIIDYISSFVGDQFPEEGRARTTLDQIINMRMKDVSEKIDSFETRLSNFETRLDKVETMFFRIADLNKIDLPVYETAPKVLFKDKPKLPKLTNPKAFTDYFKYLMQVVPQLQQILYCYRDEIELIKSSLGDASINKMEGKRKDDEESEYVKTGDLESVKRQLADYRNLHVSKEDFQILQTDVKNLKENTVDKEEFESTIDRVSMNMKQIDQKTADQMKQLEISLDETKMSIPKDPAYTEVRGKPKTAFRLLYGGDNQSVSSYASQQSLQKSTTRSVITKRSSSIDSSQALPDIRPSTATGWGTSRPKRL